MYEYRGEKSSAVEVTLVNRYTSNYDFVPSRSSAQRNHAPRSHAKGNSYDELRQGGRVEEAPSLVGKERQDAMLDDSDDNILHRLCRHARARPDRLIYKFLREDGGTHTLTFGELHRRVMSLAIVLREHAAQGDRAILLYPSGLEFIEAFLACLAAGLVAVPAYPPRRNRHGDRLRAILEDARPRLILTTSRTVPFIDVDEGTSICLATDDIGERATDQWHPPSIRGDTVAFLQYTSGSTGTPRGVVVTHGNLTANERAIESSFGNTPDSVLVGWLPFFHDMGLIGNLLQPLFVGFPATLFSPAAFLREPALWLQAISDCRATTSGAPNFAYDHCVKSITEQQKQGLDLSSWAVAYNGAEPVRAETLDRFAAAFSAQGFRAEAFFPCFGLAESTLFVSGGPPGRPQVVVSPTIGLPARRLVSCGRVADGARVEIVNPKTLSACPPGEIGEVWIASASVAHGYWNRPQETKATFEARLADTGEGPFLRTGDLGFLLDGELYISGRLKDMINIRGRNLYPQDIEVAVERVLPFLKANASAAFGVEVGGEERLAVVVEADRHLVRRAREVADSPKELDDLIAQVRQAISDEFEVAVHAVAFVRPGTFPRTSSGKVQRQACRDGLLAGKLDLVFDWQTPCPSSMAASEQSEGQDTIRERIHAEVLRWVRSKVDATIQRIDYDASFVSLGIDSVGAMSIALDVEKAMGERVDLDALYDYPTIHQLAGYLGSRLTRTDSARG